MVDRLVQLLHGRRVAVLTGAGCSTESGIPDYGGLASRRRRTTVQYRAFVSNQTVRARYWARSAVGWPRVAWAKPNGAHHALAELERIGLATGIITQNVDGLHHRAGNRRVVELHGSLARVRCMSCGGVVSRAGFQEHLLALNPGFGDRTASTAPDGDAEVDDDRLRSFRVPDCRTCGGMLKPDVVFFGESVPKPRVQDAWAILEKAEVLFVVGSSLAVFSGYRFVLRAIKESRPVVIVNMGPTRGDEHAAVKIDDRVGAVLPPLVDRLRDRWTVPPSRANSNTG